MEKEVEKEEERLEITQDEVLKKIQEYVDGKHPEDSGSDDEEDLLSQKAVDRMIREEMEKVQKEMF